MTEWQDKTVVGVSFEGRAEILRKLGEGAEYVSHGWKIKKVNCVLIPQTGNPHDPFAVGVWVDDQQVGFLPGGNDAVHAHLLLLHPDGFRIAGAIFLKGRYNPTLKLHTLAWFGLRRKAGDLNPR